MINIRIAKLEDRNKWNDFALSKKEVRHCHLWEYSSAVEKAYKYKRLNIVIEKNDISRWGSLDTSTGYGDKRGSCFLSGSEIEVSKI